MENFVAEVIRTLQIFGGTFIVLTLGFNFNARWPRYPWDLSVDRFGFHMYIPVISSMVISILLTILIRLFSPSSGGFLR